MNRFLVTTIVISIAIHLATAYFILTHWQIVPVTPERSNTDLVVVKPPPPPPPKPPEPDDPPPDQKPPRVNPKPPVPPPAGVTPPDPIPVPAQPVPVPSTEGADRMTAPEPQPERPAYRVQPKYPVAAEEEGVEGAVILIVTIDGEGNVLAVVVEKAEPPGWFESAATSAVRRWKYKGTGQTRQVRVVVAFELN